MKPARIILLLICLPFLCIGQQPGTENNGTIDDFTEFATPMTVPFPMPDGIHLYTDIYVPVLSDCLVFEIMIDTNFLGLNIQDSFGIELIAKGTQILVYDSITPPDTVGTSPLQLQWNYYDPQNLVANPNPYQMPLIFTRTPYNKEGDDVMALMTMLGYASAIQDMRGRYSSEGVYLPMYSDSWNKDPYHSSWGHVLDQQTTSSDEKAGNKHEDGYNSIRFMSGAYIQDSSLSWLNNHTTYYDVDTDGEIDEMVGINELLRSFDINGDGVQDTFNVSTGNIGTFGASALGNTQYQEAAAHRIDPLNPGLKCMVPIVATNEHHKYTGFQNGVFRDRIVTGWLKGQIFTGVEDDSSGVAGYFRNKDEAMGNPGGVHNTLHTSWDYGMPNKYDAANQAIDHFTSWRPNNELAGAYPNSIGRMDMDASRAMVDAQGEGNSNGTHSRYTNMEVPAYHLFGWWDIFVDGQIETNNLMRKHISSKNRGLQKMIIGPWAHQTIGSSTTGDQSYPDNVNSVMGLDISEIDGNELPIADILGSELVSWYRHNLNYSKGLGEPKVLIPESNKWQPGGGGLCGVDSVRIPSEDYVIEYKDFINFIGGNSGLPEIQIEVSLCQTGIASSMSFPIPAGNALIPGLDSGSEVVSSKDKDFSNPDTVPPVRFYVVGDGLDNTVGNYWFEAHSFPLVHDIQWTPMYLHQNGGLNFTPPIQDEGYKIYVHDPDDPVITTGGANMIVRTPQDDRNSQGQMNLADPSFSSYSLERPGVIQFTSSPITENNGFAGDSISIIGFPVFTLYAKSNPSGLPELTDTDFMVRVIDVCPDGRELFVVEGCINARARNYAKAMVHGADGSINYHGGFPEDEPQNGIDDISYSNIQSGQLYEYTFKMMPIAYTFGPNHRIKILISSSNYPRYQVNPNLPIEEGDFFRRKPGDGQQYTYEGHSMAPRVAVQRIAFSPDFKTHIDLPVYAPGTIASDRPAQNTQAVSLDALLYPNPVKDHLNIYMNQKGSYQLEIHSTMGQNITSQSFLSSTRLDLSSLPAGMYYAVITHRLSGESTSCKFIR